MAPPPEYDKEPKAPDKSVTSNSVEDTKLAYNHIKDLSSNTEHKTTTAAANVDVENNKHVETLDDGQLRALLDEAITYKCPKDREGKSSLFKELLEEVEQDEQACEAAARLGAGRTARRARARREHHSSLQDLVAAMAGEAAPRRGRAHAQHAPAPAAGTVSARALHGGSLPSGVDTSFLLGEEAGVGSSRGGYLATVRCVNPPPLAERRVSTGDASPPQQPPPPAQELDVLTRRSKPMFPMTYTARATLEIGSGSVCSGRAVTTTTASNQVRTASPAPRTHTPAHRPASPQTRLMSALCVADTARAGGGASRDRPRGPTAATMPPPPKPNPKNKKEELNSVKWVNTVNNWYEGLDRYSYRASTSNENMNSFVRECGVTTMDTKLLQNNINIFDNNIQKVTAALTTEPTRNNYDDTVVRNMEIYKGDKLNSNKGKKLSLKDTSINELKCDNVENKEDFSYDNESDISLRRHYREIVGNDLLAPRKIKESPRNFRSLTVGKPLCTTNDTCKDVGKPIQKLQKNTKNARRDKKLTKVNEVNHSSVLKKAVKVHGSIEKESIISDVEKQDSPSKLAENCSGLNVEIIKKENSVETYLEMVDIPFNNRAIDDSNSFTEYVAQQKKLIEKFEINYNDDNCYTNTDIANKSPPRTEEAISKIIDQKVEEEMNIETYESPANLTVSKYDGNNISNGTFSSMEAELPNNAYILLTFPQSYPPPKVTEIGSEVNSTNAAVVCNENKPVKKNKKKSKQPKASVSAKKEGLNKNALKMLLYSDSPEKTDYIKKKLSSFKDKEVDSAIPFSCITTPEVVASCNTTSSTSQSAVAVDPKPLQLVSSYRAVACLMDEVCARAPSPPQHAPSAPSALPVLPASSEQQPRGAVASFNGLPLSRPAAADEYKKSLDENGNAVQGFGSPLSGSGQHKKPRRKKSSKNETVIKSHQIDGYQGNKDLNEVLRFIESNAEGARAPKLRAKHKDDGDDKAAKKRSTERRKDKDAKPKRASSLEELSRTTLEDLTDKPREPAPAKPERRSWGADARALLEPDPPPELADFQTVTKKRKPRRRTDETERAPSPPRRARAPSPARAPASAPASERSNDSNDDTDCAHSPPPPPAPSAPPPPVCASYADIARTRHNIPDLIESCNFYVEGEERERTAAPAAGAPRDDADQYPALAARRRDKPPPRKEPPAPDVVADRRPPVVLLAAGAGAARDMDGVTFGFDVNEQLLGARCDLLERAVAVRAGCAALRYVPPPPSPAPLLHQIVDYVGTAWEDVMRGGGKAHYFSECVARGN